MPHRNFKNGRGNIRRPYPPPILTAALVCAHFCCSIRARADEPSFSHDVRPILADMCFKCHGPDDKGRKGKLQLNEREPALQGGKSGHPAIVPGNAGASEMIKRLHASDPDEQMPPPSMKKSLSPAQLALLEKWIAGGAKYEKHWAFQAPLPPSIPDPQLPHPIDAFVRTSLAKVGLSPSPEAERAALFRRASLDLIGLPPTPDELAAYLADPSPNAYDQAIDRLLASPHYGERWGRKWLDLARYADTNGYEKDRPRSIWPYRDWVIKAINDDMPFDQFSIEQIAGDLLPDATPAQRTATGFHRNTMLNEEGGIDPLEYRFRAMTDRVATTGATWLGLTLQCCQCHTHKYDPIPQREYYSLMAFLDNADEPDLELPSPDQARDDATRAAKAETLFAALPLQWPVPDEPTADPASLETRRKQALTKAVDDWIAKQRSLTAVWQPAAPDKATSNLPLLTVQPDATVFVSGDITKADTYQLLFDKPPAGITAIRLEALPDPRLPARGPGMAYYEGPKGDFLLGEIKLSANDHPVKFTKATASYAKNNFGPHAEAQLAIDGDPETGWSCAEGQGRAHEAVFQLEQPLTAPALQLTLMFGRHYACSLGKFRISFTTQAGEVVASQLPANVQQLLHKPDLSEAERQLLQNEFLFSAPEMAAHRHEIEDLRRPSSHLTSLVLQERPAENPRRTFIHNRGEWTQPTDPVEPAVLSILNPLPANSPKNRLGFARWLVSRDNPLTARVVVNRTWAAFFGRGIVKSQDDFGVQGTPPSHPELLDWLALRFMSDGWSCKKLHRLIVTSQTYKQSSKSTAVGEAKDPENQWLWRGPRQRLDAEAIRDSALRCAGILSDKILGPSVYPPQPASVTTEGAYGALAWNASSGENRYRRSIYTFAKRSAPFAFAGTFDGPSGEACIVRRDSSNTPLQALTLLNDVTITEAAQAMGKRLAEAPGSTEQHITDAFLRCFSRPPNPAELTAVTKFYQKQLDRFTATPATAGQVAGAEPADSLIPRAVWTTVARALMNMDEFVTQS